MPGGAGSAPLPGKAALKVKLKHKWKGLSHLTLNNLLEDPSCLSERLAYAAYRDLYPAIKEATLR